MSFDLNINTNQVFVSSSQNQIIVEDRNQGVILNVEQPISKVIEVVSRGPKGDLGFTFEDNVESYLLIATGTNTLKGESSLRYDGNGLIIGASGSAQALLQVSGSGDLLLIKNESNNGIKINNEGVLQLLSQSFTPTPVGGGMMYSGSSFYVGIN